MSESKYMAWRKASYSNDSGNCVEVASAAAHVGVRDSAEQGRGPVLVFSDSAWRGFLAGVKSGR